jgi:hypothetical protein
MGSPLSYLALYRGSIPNFYRSVTSLATERDPRNPAAIYLNLIHVKVIQFLI